MQIVFRHIHKKLVNSGCLKGEELGDWGTLFSNPFVAFVPFELFSLGVYKQFNNKVFYLKV